MAVYMDTHLILVLFTVLIISECYIAHAQSTVSGDFQPKCDNMLECQYEIRQLNNNVDNLESHMKTMLELFDSRTNDILSELSEIKVMCNKTHFELNEGKYKFMTSPKDWQAARDECFTRGGDLVTVEASEEWEYLHDLIYQHDYNNQCNAFWTSGEKRGNKWMWANGDLEIDLTWAASQPSGDGLCVTSVIDYGINDAPCSNLYCYICEYQ